MSEPVHCPSCNEPGEPGQLVCLRCGTRLALTPRKPGSGRSRATVAIAIVALGGLGLGFAIGALAAGGDDANTTQTAAQQRAAALERRQAAARREREAERLRAEVKARQQASSGTWPANLRAYTVVLVTAGDETAARQTADDAKAAGLKSGVLRSDDYDLGQGFWIVYSGTYDTQDEAASEADNLSDRYPGAYPQVVDGS